ncbi:type II toxin-antitoxin system YafQ family toxin [Megasphaera elsdenii]
MLDLIFTTKFKKDYKRMRKRGKDKKKLEDTLDMLMKGILLPKDYHDHELQGRYIGFRECHIEPDWLLIYAINQEELILVASRTGSHSDLFT